MPSFGRTGRAGAPSFFRHRPSGRAPAAVRSTRRADPNALAPKRSGWPSLTPSQKTYTESTWPVPHPNNYRRYLLVLAACFAAVLAGQWAANAYNGELAGTYDEPAHYVTTLMVREYALDPFQSPMAFAENYYLHYPKVGLGHWPPMLYIVLALWSIPFGASQASMLVGIAAISAGAAALLFGIAKRLTGSGFAAAITALWLLQRSAQEAAATVMSESLLILLCLAAIISYQEFLESESWRWGAGFGLFASFALLTKGTAISLALVPPFAILLSGRFRLLLNWRFWLPAAIVLLLAGPWYLLADSFIPSAQGSSLDRALSLTAVDTPSERAATYFTVGGRWVSGAIVLGMLAVLGIVARRKQDWLRWSVAAAFVIAACATHFLLPESESPRHLAYALPAGLLLAGGAAVAMSRLGSRGRIGAWALLATLFAGFGTEQFRLYDKPGSGMPAALDMLGEAAVSDDEILLVCADSREEGALIAEVAERRPLPGPVVLRASKVFAKSSWGGWNYTTRMATEDEVARYLQQAQPHAVILGGPPPARAAEHYHLVVRTVESRPSEWRQVFAGETGAVRVFRPVASSAAPRGAIRLDMGTRLNKTLELAPAQRRD